MVATKRPDPPSPPNPTDRVATNLAIKGYVTKIRNWGKANGLSEPYAIPNMMKEWMDKHGDRVKELCCIEQRDDGNYYFVDISSVNSLESPDKKVARFEAPSTAVAGSVEEAQFEPGNYVLPKGITFSEEQQLKVYDGEDVVVVEKITEKAFDRMFETVHLSKEWIAVPPTEGPASRSKVRYGQVVIYDFPTIPHDKAAGALKDLLFVQVPRYLQRHTGTYTVNANRYEPDEALIPKGRTTGPGVPKNSDGNEYPTIVIEGAWSESATHIRAKALEWINPLHTTVQECWVIKLFPRQRGRMWFERYVTGAAANPVGGTLEFGNVMPRGAPPACVGAGLPAFQVSVPVATVFHGAAGILAGGNFTVDLYEVQQQVLSVW